MKINSLIVAVLIGTIAIASTPPSALAVPAGVPVLTATADTNTTSTASTGTNSVAAGNGAVNTLVITKSNTNSVIVSVTTDQGVTVFSNAVTGIRSVVRPRLYVTDTAGNTITNLVPEPVQFSGNLNLNAFAAAVTGISVSVSTQVQR